MESSTECNNFILECWIHEYLPSLTQRKKWNSTKRKIKKGDLVLLTSKDITRAHWTLVRVAKTFPGKDDIVRAVELKTPSAVLVRPVGKVCLLERFK